MCVAKRKQHTAILIFVCSLKFKVIWH